MVSVTGLERAEVVVAAAVAVVVAVSVGLTSMGCYRAKIIPLQTGLGNSGRGWEPEKREQEVTPAEFRS
jgi:hypothetical protein